MQAIREIIAHLAARGRLSAEDLHYLRAEGFWSEGIWDTDEDRSEGDNSERRFLERQNESALWDLWEDEAAAHGARARRRGARRPSVHRLSAAATSRWVRRQRPRFEPACEPLIALARHFAPGADYTRFPLILRPRRDDELDDLLRGALLGEPEVFSRLFQALAFDSYREVCAHGAPRGYRRLCAAEPIATLGADAALLSRDPLRWVWALALVQQRLLARLGELLAAGDPALVRWLRRTYDPEVSLVFLLVHWCRRAPGFAPLPGEAPVDAALLPVPESMGPLWDLAAAIDHRAIAAALPLIQNRHRDASRVRPQYTDLIAAVRDDHSLQLLNTNLSAVAQLDPVFTAALSPDGLELAALHARRFSYGHKRYLRRYATADLSCALDELELPIALAPLRDTLEFSPDGNAVRFFDRVAQCVQEWRFGEKPLRALWHWEQAALTVPRPDSMSASGSADDSFDIVAYSSPDGRELIVFVARDRVEWRRMDTGEVLACVPIEYEDTAFAAFVGGRQLAVVPAQQRREILLWSPGARTPDAAITLPAAPLDLVATDDGAFLMVATVDEDVLVYDLSHLDAAPKKVGKTPQRHFRTFQTTPDGRQVVLAGSAQLRLIDRETGESSTRGLGDVVRLRASHAATSNPIVLYRPADWARPFVRG